MRPERRSIWQDQAAGIPWADTAPADTPWADTADSEAPEDGADSEAGAVSEDPAALAAAPAEAEVLAYGRCCSLWEAGGAGVTDEAETAAAAALRDLLS